MNKNQCLKCGRENKYNKPYKYGYCRVGECEKIYVREWLAIPENRERHNAQVREQKRALLVIPEEREKINARRRALRAIPENREKVNARKREAWRNKYYSMTEEQKTEYNKKKQRYPITEEKFLEVATERGMYKDGQWQCYICLEWYIRELIVKEHILPVKYYKKLEREPANILPACASCNGSKNDRVEYGELRKVFTREQALRIGREQARVLDFKSWV